MSGRGENHRYSSRLRHVLAAVAIILLATACSSSPDDDSGESFAGDLSFSREALPVEPDEIQVVGQGRIYFATQEGTVHTFDPEANASGEFWKDFEVGLVFAVAQDGEDGLMASVRNPLNGTIANRRLGDAVSLVFDDRGFERLVCFDNRPTATGRIAHSLTSVDSQFDYRAVNVPDGADPTDLEGHDASVHIACPKWDNFRTRVASTQAGSDPDTLELLIEGPGGDRRFSRAGCSLVPLGFNPTDTTLAVSAVCGPDNPDTGVYLLDTASDTFPTSKAMAGAMEFGAWSPSGDRLATSIVTPPAGPGQSSTSELVILDVGSLESTVVALPAGVNPGSLAWIHRPVQ